MAIRKRIGLIVPSTNTTVEPDFRMAAPRNVTVHSHRMWMDEDTTTDIVDRMNADVEQAARYLATASVDLIVYACTGGSFYKGRGYDRELLASIEAAAGVPAEATAPAAADALAHLGVKAISVTSPYGDWRDERLKEYYTECGFDVLNVDGEPVASAAGNSGICDQPPESVLEFSAGACRPEAEALFCSCTAWRSMEVAAELEQRLSRPVVTSNQATVWAAFKRLDVEPKPGFGSLIDSLAKAAV
jgi:maleate cis-trans isomerase